jgi:hypothetical protein
VGEAPFDAAKHGKETRELILYQDVPIKGKKFSAGASKEWLDFIKIVRIRFSSSHIWVRQACFQKNCRLRRPVQLTQLRSLTFQGSQASNITSNMERSW